MRRAAGVAAVVSALAAAAAQSGGAQSPPATCSAKRVAGASWRVLITKNVACDSAYGIVGQLARRTIPASHVYGGTYAGMRCFGGPRPGGLPKSIVCGTTSKTRMFSAYLGL